MVSKEAQPFWKRKTLEAMSPEEWESLCDGCALCCLIRLEDEDTGQVVLSNVHCKYLDTENATCTDYCNRHTNVPDCVELTPEKVRAFNWLPDTCAYRLVAAGKDLYPWHPLVSGYKESVHEAGISPLGRMVHEEAVEDLEDYVIECLIPPSSH